MEDFHFPPFLVDRSDRRLVTVEVATSQVQNPGAPALVRGGLAALVDSDEMALLFVFQGQRHRPVAFEGATKCLPRPSRTKGRFSCAEIQLSART